MKIVVILLVVGFASAQFFDYEEYVPDKNVKGKKNKMIKVKNMITSGRGKIPMPAFLEKATDETKKEVRDVLLNKDLTRDQVDARIETILKKDRPEVQEAFAVFKSEIESRKIQRISEHEQKRERLSEEAQKADKQLIAILEDPSLTMAERQDKMRNTFDAIPKPIKEELKSMRNDKRNNNRVTQKIREVGEQIRDIHLSVRDAIRSAFNRPMRRLRYRPEQQQPEKVTQIETKPIRTSDDGQFLEI